MAELRCRKQNATAGGGEDQEPQRDLNSTTTTPVGEETESNPEDQEGDVESAEDQEGDVESAEDQEGGVESAEDQEGDVESAEDQGDQEGDVGAEEDPGDQEGDVGAEEDPGDQEGDVGAEEDQGKKTPDDGDEENAEQEKEVPDKKSSSKKSGTFQRVVKLFFGCMAAMTCGVVYTGYLSTYHDRKFWFSSRQELEREISLQGGSGFYYYYYKHMLSVPSFEMGVLELTLDNRTISGQTFNAVERLSLYPEIITAFVYRVTDSQALYVTALFVTSWALSGTWVSGMLAVAWFIINNNSAGASQELFCHLTMSATTFSFLLLWEHSHYVLFVQALCLLLMDSLDLVPARKVVDVHWVYLSSLFLVYMIRFQSHGVLSCPLLCLLIGSLLARYFQKNMKVGPISARLMKLLFHFYLVFTTGITFSYLVKKVIPASDGDFMLKFFEVKFGFNTTTDFVTNFLLCQDGFQSPSQELFLRLTQASVLPFYLLVLAVCLLSTLQTVYSRLRGQPIKTNLRLEDGRIGEQPEVAYHVLHTMLFGGLAMVSEGMKYLWTPHVCMLTAFGVCSPDLWMTVFKWLRLRSIHPVVLALILSTAVPTIIGFSLWREFFPRVLGELSELQEIYDADTVELVNWIRSQAPAGSVFGGSPQVMGVVKMCTGLAVTSLPLYFDLGLLRRSEDTCQVYARRSAEDVYKILVSQKTNYVIVEDALCDEYAHKPACRMKDLLDISNGHVVYNQGEIYSFSKHGRFCSEIKLNYSPYTNYFTRLFWNRSYHIYRVNTVLSFQY
ncbi:hypothetical protein NHX12_024272 [Muraenolepis orangiensis]|uniref:C-mannosyltransferase DPY19L4 n=1 Tax=Muraenolepis orangiensis TaxID=630683 RepID=A0A9Q0IUN4_9TELE|nr:hypothetical protein NHX12_024272 [Muraenolepis orangiensis]